MAHCVIGVETDCCSVCVFKHVFVSAPSFDTTFTLEFEGVRVCSHIIHSNREMVVLSPNRSVKIYCGLVRVEVDRNVPVFNRF